MWTNFNVNSTSNVNVKLMSNTDVSWHGDLVVFRLCNQNPTLSQRQIDVKYGHQPDFHFQPKCNVCLTSCPTSTWRYIDVWCLLGEFSSNHNQAQLIQLIKIFRIGSWLELNCAELRPSSRNWVWHHWSIILWLISFLFFFFFSISAKKCKYWQCIRWRDWKVHQKMAVAHFGQRWGKKRAVPNANKFFQRYVPNVNIYQSYHSFYQSEIVWITIRTVPLFVSLSANLSLF